MRTRCGTVDVVRTGGTGPDDPEVDGSESDNDIAELSAAPPGVVGNPKSGAVSAIFVFIVPKL
jgi:hypothetical protein